MWFMKMDGIRYRYVPSPLSRGACFCPLSFYYVFARDPLVTLCGHVAFRCNVICCMFVLFKSSVGVGQGFMCHYLALCFCLSRDDSLPIIGGSIHARQMGKQGRVSFGNHTICPDNVVLVGSDATGVSISPLSSLPS